MSTIAMAWAMREQLPALSKMLLITLADHHNAETGQCNPSIRRICAVSGMTARTANAHTKALSRSGTSPSPQRHATTAPRPATTITWLFPTLPPTRPSSLLTSADENENYRNQRQLLGRLSQQNKHRLRGWAQQITPP